MMYKILKFGRKINLLLAAFLLLAATPFTFAHEGHDHSHDEPAAVSVGAGLETRSARVGDYEIFIKNPPLEPDTETSARVFLTWAQTNVPIDTAAITIIIGRENGQLIEINVEPDAKLAGSYTAKLPPIPQGEVKIAARWTVGATTETADFGAANIQSKTSESFTAFGWLPDALFVVAFLVVMSLIAGIVWFGVHRLKNETRVVEVKNQTVSA